MQWNLRGLVKFTLIGIDINIYHVIFLVYYNKYVNNLTKGLLKKTLWSI